LNGVKHLKSAAITAALFFLVACGSGRTATPDAQARIVLNTDSPRPTIDVVDIPPDQIGRIYGTDSRDAWTAILKISVGADQPATIGQYAIEDTRIRFTPMFPLDHGRQYHVTFTPPGGQPITAKVGLPAEDTTPKTTVAQVYPTAAIVPENQLRLYIHFSAPMGMRGGLDFVHLLDEAGKEVTDPFLPLDAEFWNDDRTRYTVFFDPGRQKRGIAPIAEMGRSLTGGKSYTLVVDAQWLDGHRLPLKQSFRRTFKVGPPDEKPLDPKTWKIQMPAAGTTDPLTVTFPEALDHGLLMRALGVLAPNGKPLEGEVIVGPEELTWAFTPDQPWKAGAHNLLALAMLEDLAGNRIGRAFEVDQFNRTDTSGEPDRTLIPFTIR
jgi:hypothetical protein